MPKVSGFVVPKLRLANQLGAKYLQSLQYHAKGRQSLRREGKTLKRKGKTPKGRGGEKKNR